METSKYVWVGVAMLVVIVVGVIVYLLSKKPSTSANPMSPEAQYAAAVGAAQNEQTQQYLDFTGDITALNACKRDCRVKYCPLGALGIGCKKAGNCFQACTAQFSGEPSPYGTPANTVTPPSKNQNHRILYA